MRKTYFFKFIFLFLLTTCTFKMNLYATEFQGTQADSIIKGSQLVSIEDDNQTLKFVRFTKNNEPTFDDITTWTQEFISRFSNGVHLSLAQQKTDNIGYTHYSFKQYIDNIQVEYSTIKVHTNQDGAIYSVNAEYYPTENKVSGLDCTKEHAIQLSKQHFANQDIPLLSIKSNYKGVYYLSRDGKPLILCHKLDVQAVKDGRLKKSRIYLSHTDGNILFEENRIIHTNTTAVAYTKYNGTVQLTVDSLNPNAYELNTSSPKAMTTRDMNNSTDHNTASVVFDGNNIWDVDTIANDVHYGTEKTFDYFLNTHGRNSYNDSGARLNSYVHYGSNFVNAFWDGAQMTYGDGDGVTYGPLVSIDVVAHEITHAITEFSAGLIYANESGALNESFSDIFGIAVEHYANPAAGNFTIGEQFALGNTPPFRNLADPKSSYDPDTYKGIYWDHNFYPSVHNNGTAHTYWFYLLCKGGSGINDNAENYTVDSIGMTDATAIAYRALTQYLTPNATYTDSRTATIQSAIDLFGQCSQQEKQVSNAWHAIGVDSAYNNFVHAGYSVNRTNFCSAPATAIFTNSSTHAGSFYWDFGDGDTSTQANPTHIYTTPGVYTVTLIAYSSSLCAGTDTLLITNHITVSTSGVTPAPAPCQPATINYCCGNGIINFKLDSINNASPNASEGYKDYTCGNHTSLIAGSVYPMEIALSGYYQDVQVFIDYNSDTSFSATENVFYSPYSSNSGFQHNLVVPANSLQNVPLRLRVISYGNSNLANACTDPYNGQAEDYVVTIIPPSGPPTAKFEMSDSVVATNGYIQLTDLSFNGPTAWNWSFPGAITPSSTNRNPGVAYNSPGVYPVTLVASNSFGSDTTTQYLYVVPELIMCTDSASTDTMGSIFDSGGRSNNYSNYEDCYFLIEPTGCVDSIILSFKHLDINSFGNDYLKIYDGPTTNHPLLVQATGSYGLPTFISSTNKVLLHFHSDNTGVDPGFEIIWSTKSSAPSSPVASFSLNLTNPAVLQTVSFQNTSSANTNAVLWDFGDGSTSTLFQPTHAYAAPGSYNVSLVVTSCNNLKDTSTYTITVQASPQISFNPPSFNINLDCDDTTSVDLIISNTNGGKLDWIIQNATVTSNDVLAWSKIADSTNLNIVLDSINNHYSDFMVTKSYTDTPSVLGNQLKNKKVLFVPFPSIITSSSSSSFNSIINNFIVTGGTVIFGQGGGSNVFNFNFIQGNAINSSSNGSFILSDTTTPLTDNLPLTFTAPAWTWNRFYLSNPNRVDVIKLNNDQVVSYFPHYKGKLIMLGLGFSPPSLDQSLILANAVRWGIEENKVNKANVLYSKYKDSLFVNQSDTVRLEFNSTNLIGSIDTSYLLISSNDSSSMLDSIPLYINITSMPCLAYDFELTSPCAGYVQFTDKTSNSPTSWYWDFGDGNSSTMQNPLHEYTSTGSFTAKLIATNSTGTDSISHTLAITTIGGPAGAICEPISPNPSYWHGIKTVSIGTLYDSTGPSTEGNLDLTCTDSVTLQCGTQYPLNIETFSWSDAVRIWIDTNNNGVFESHEELTYFPANLGPLLQANVLIPTITNHLNSPLRMRVTCGDGGVDTNSCAPMSAGQAQDYTVKLINTPLPPIANFTTTTNYFTVPRGDSLSFNDLSSNGPSTWNWTFNSGLPSSSNAQNTTILFPTVGIFPVKLVVSNAYGSDSITKYVQVVEIFNVCMDDTVTQTAGVVYDSGGPTGNYHRYDNCSLLIDPGSCTDSIQLYITQVQLAGLYNDSLRVYDGPDANSPLLFSVPTSTLPNMVTATSGKMFITFDSDNWQEAAGFEAFWTAFQSTGNAPTANFTPSNINPAHLETVSFQNTSSANSTQWKWYFGDGDSSQSKHTTHKYSQPGSYTVSLVTTSCNAFDTVQQTITVQALPSMSYMPNSFNVNLACNDTVDLDLFISNTNGGTLNWNVSNDSFNNKVLVWLHGVDTLQEYPNMINAITQHYTNFNLSSTFTTSPSVMQNLLADKKVLLIPEKESGSNAVTQSFQTVLNDYVQNGGHVIICGDKKPTALHSGLFSGFYMPQYSFGGITNVVDSSTILTDSIPAYVYTPDSIYPMNFINTDYQAVIQNLAGYRQIGSGKAIYLGYDYRNLYAINTWILSNAVKWSIEENNTYFDPNYTLSQYTGSLTSSNTDSVHIEINSSGLNGGLDTTYVVLNSNNPSLVDSIPIYMNISTDPCVDFNYNYISQCGGQVQFNDSSLNNPISWSWNFGDGNTSNLQHPTHTYLANGSYQVKLVVSNASGIDSLTQAINITTYPALAVTCTENTAPSGNGIIEFNLGNIHSVSPSDTEGYRDFTCVYIDTLKKGVGYPIEIISPSFGQQYYSLFVDTNHNGQLAYNEVIFTNQMRFGSYIDTVVFPLDAVTNATLRLRVICSDAPHYLCGNLNGGQSEDYTIVFQDTLPIANFSGTPTTVYVNQAVQFTDLSAPNPTAWNWNFPGANTTSSTSQNPTATYTTPGTYDVRLIASNNVGPDTILQSNYVTVIPLPPMTTFSYFNINCEGKVNFINNFPNPYTQVEYHFGDGNTQINSSSLTTHTYAISGLYSVMVVGMSPYGNDTIYQNVSASSWFGSISSTAVGLGIPVSFSVGTSVPLQSYQWDLGNGSNSTLASPTTTYNNPGTYYVSVLLEDTNQCSKTFYDTLVIKPNATSNYNFSSNIKVFPNPFDQQIQLSFSDLGFAEKLEIEITNALGQIVHKDEKKRIGLDRQKMTIATHGFAPGSYFIQVKIDGDLYVLKLLKIEQ